MPIGKNAIKRVENNGYSKVVTTAPDMENSNVIANPDPQVVEKLITPVETAAKKPAAKKPAAKKPAMKKCVAKPVEKPAEKEGFVRVEVGNDMPYYLL